jgi:NADH:ubiquinone oxidoreductase subunit F (NADH-binding)/(2Fe-2S) ferredoxin
VNKLKNINALEILKKEGLKRLYPDNIRIGIGMATCGIASGAKNVFDTAKKYIIDKNAEIDLFPVGCLGLCQHEPLVDIYRPGMPRIVYGNVNSEIIIDILEALGKGKEYQCNIIYKSFTDTFLCKGIIKKLCDNEYSDNEYSNHHFFNKQMRIALRNCGYIDLENISEYIARGGYFSLAKALSSIPREKIIKEIIDSGLRGRGGGGFSTGFKWDACYKADSPVKYVICNADEGDPGAYMDRSIIEGDPHSIIEGMTIGAYAVGANIGYVYIRTEYPLAVKGLEHAIMQARQTGLLGKKILGSDFDFNIIIAQGSGAFVCGESSALIASIEGNPGEPRAKHIHMTESGLFAKPTTLNNVETWANVPAIISKGASWFASIGTEKSKGTKVFSLVGNINISGLVEVPMGITLAEIVYDIGNGIPKGRKLKAVQTGGPSGGCIPADQMNLQVDFDSLKNVGSIMGSGGMIVMDDHTCMVDIARYFTEFLIDESCGKCNSCREGLKHMAEALNRICSGLGENKDITLLEDLCEVVSNASLCGLGASAPNPVKSTLKYFRSEYITHIQDKKCPAKVCKSLLKYIILQDNCIGCSACLKECPVQAISGEKKQPHKIDESKCIKCGSCADVCKFKAVDII